MANPVTPLGAERGDRVVGVTSVRTQQDAWSAPVIAHVARYGPWVDGDRGGQRRDDQVIADPTHSTTRRKPGLVATPHLTTPHMPLPWLK